MAEDEVVSASRQIHVQLAINHLLAYRSALFWDITQRRMVILYRLFGTTHRSMTSWPLKMGPAGCPETSVKNYRSTLHNVREERNSHHLRSGSLKSSFSLVKTNCERWFCLSVCA
jgi:hypothetical protein